MRIAFAFAAALPLCAQDAREIVRHSLDRERANDRIARQYTFIQRIERRQVDSDGKVSRRESKTYDVTLLEGSPYSRLIAHNDKPLDAGAERKERNKLVRDISDRRTESKAERSRRVAEWQAKREKDRDQFRKMLDAFDLRIVGEETIEGEPAWVIDATPRPGYKPDGGLTRLFPKMKGRIWITKNGYGWARADAETTDTVSFGGFIARVYEGTRFRYEQMRISGDVWVPKHLTAAYSGRILLIKPLRGELDVTYHSYKKFHADSRVVSISEPVTVQ